MSSSWFVEEATTVVPWSEEAYMTMVLGRWWRLVVVVVIPSLVPAHGVWVDVGELGEGPVVFPVLLLLAAPEEECWNSLKLRWSKGCYYRKAWIVKRWTYTWRISSYLSFWCCCYVSQYYINKQTSSIHINQIFRNLNKGQFASLLLTIYHLKKLIFYLTNTDMSS